MKWYVNSVGAPVVEDGKVVGTSHVTLRPVGYDADTKRAMGPHPDGMITLARTDLVLRGGECFELALTECAMPAAPGEEKK